MNYPRPLANLIKQANTLEANAYPEKIVGIKANIITPEKTLVLVVPTGMATLSLFGVNHTDDIKIKGQIQPGVYLDEILPFKDNLFMEVIIRYGFTQRVFKYRAIPLGDEDPEVIGSNTQMASIKATDELNLISVEFQLIEQGYALLKNKMVSGIYLMSDLEQVLNDIYTEEGETLNLFGADSWKGVNIVKPIDNKRLFKTITVPAGVGLVKLASFLQNHEEFGIYATGLGSYYRKGYWYVYPLFRLGQYDKAERVLNIYRMPDNVMPVIKRSYFENGKVLTIFSTGDAQVEAGRDIDKQNQGIGKRIVSSDTIMLETGNYYSNGQAIVTRADSLKEVKTSSRGSGEEIIPFHDKPTNNFCKVLSHNALNEGIIVTLRWTNSSHNLITPGMPMKYYYMNNENSLEFREGTVLAIRSEYVKDTESVQPLFREHSVLTIFLDKEVREE